MVQWPRVGGVHGVQGAGCMVPYRVSAGYAHLMEEDGCIYGGS